MYLMLRMCIYVWWHVCMYICLYACMMYECMYVCIYTCRSCIQNVLLVSLFSCLTFYVCVCLPVVRMYVCKYVCIWMSAYLDVNNTYIHTYIHIIALSYFCLAITEPTENYRIIRPQWKSISVKNTKRQIFRRAVAEHLYRFHCTVGQ